jgi:tRNA(adenine34) deaminase
VKKYNFENKFMLLAMEQAKEAFAQDEVPVGCIIVRKDDGVIVASTKNTMQQSKKS